MIKILQFSDTHFDRPFDLIKPEDFASRYSELKNSFSAVMQYINDQEIDLALIPGDLFDAETLSSDTLSFIKRGFASCPDCRFFISPGDADPYTQDSPYRDKWPINVHIFTQEKLEQVHLDELNCDIYGAAVTKNTPFSALMENVEPFAINRTNLLVIHGVVEDDCQGVYRFPGNILKDSGFDYIALGHRHQADNPVFSGNYAYSGTIMGHGFEECGSKGALRIDIENRNLTVKEVKFSTHSYLKLKVDITQLCQYGTTDQAIAEFADQKLSEVVENRSKSETISVIISLVGSINENVQFNTSNISKLIESVADPIVQDNTTIQPRSPILAGIKAGVNEEARECGCPDLAEHVMKLIVAQLHDHD